MNMTELKRRIEDLSVLEVSIVETPANLQEFLIYKDLNMTEEPVKKEEPVVIEQATIVDGIEKQVQQTQQHNLTEDISKILQSIQGLQSTVESIVTQQTQQVTKEEPTVATSLTEEQEDILDFIEKAMKLDPASKDSRADFKINLMIEKSNKRMTKGRLQKIAEVVAKLSEGSSLLKELLEMAGEQQQEDVTKSLNEKIENLEKQILELKTKKEEEVSKSNQVSSQQTQPTITSSLFKGVI